MDKTNGTHTTKDLKQAYRTSYLIAGFIRHSLTEAERSELDDWIVASEDNMRFFGKVTDENSIAASLAAFEKMKVEEELLDTKKHLQFNEASKVNRLWQYAIAASIIIAVSIYINVSKFNKKKKDKEIIAVQTTDINPGSDKATLTLENGKVIELGNLVHDTNFNGQVNILKQKGEIIYSSTAPSSEPIYHTLSIPRKGHYKLTLPDGTNVWLNAESSIRYPVAFSANERKVFVTGETFFEVAKDKDKPFRVVARDMTVEALGTKFNINAYTNEPYMATTLEEGSVLVTKGKDENILKPGQQAQVYTDHFTILPVNTKEVCGWKSNEFVFVNTPLEVILRQVERWYDAEVVYEDKINVHLNASIERDVKVSKLLEILQATGHVKFEVDGKKIKVSEQR